MVALELVVDDEAVVRALHNIVGVMDRVVELAAEELEKDVRSEGGRVSSRLGAPWEIKGTGPIERRVEAPEWWAHFLAGGTKEHGPRSADRLVFTVAGEQVFAQRVRGIRATHFDERAVERARGRVDDVIRRAIKEAA